METKTVRLLRGAEKPMAIRVKRYYGIAPYQASEVKGASQFAKEFLGVYGMSIEQAFKLLQEKFPQLLEAI